jgi:hypothetical protein
MAAGHDRRTGIVDAGAPRDDVADLIHPHRQARVAAPGDEQVAGFAVEIGQRDPPDPAIRGRADLRHLHMAVPQPSLIHPQRFHWAVPPCVRQFGCAQPTGDRGQDGTMKWGRA